MAKTIITIGREYCTGGNYIAEDVANALGIKLYDKELITMAAKHSGLSEEAVAASEKRHTHSLLYSLYTMGNELPLGFELSLSSDNLPLKVERGFLLAWLWSRRLTEPPRPANAGYHIVGRGDRAKVSKGRSQSRQTGSVLWSCPQARNLASADAHPLGSFRRRSCHARTRMTEDTLPLAAYFQACQDMLY